MCKPYPLANSHITMENHPVLWENSLLIPYKWPWMAMFNSNFDITRGYPIHPQDEVGAVFSAVQALAP